MTKSASGAVNRDNLAVSFESHGKILFTLDNFRLLKGEDRDLVIFNKSTQVLNFVQIEHFETEIVAFDNDGLSNIDLDFYFTPDLTATTEQAVSENKNYRVKVDGTITDVSSSDIELTELLSFDKDLAANKKIEILGTCVSYFSSNQSTSIAQNGKSKLFEIPYTLGPGAKLVIKLSNEDKLPVVSGGQDVDVDFVIVAYLR